MGVVALFGWKVPCGTRGGSERGTPTFPGESSA